MKILRRSILETLHDRQQAFLDPNNSGVIPTSSAYWNNGRKFAHLSHVPLEEIASAKFPEEIRPVLTAFPDT
jgi:hypothetical protein